MKNRLKSNGQTERHRIPLSLSSVERGLEIKPSGLLLCVQTIEFKGSKWAFKKGLLIGFFIGVICMFFLA